MDFTHTFKCIGIVIIDKEMQKNTSDMFSIYSSVARNTMIQAAGAHDTVGLINKQLHFESKSSATCLELNVCHTTCSMAESTAHDPKMLPYVYIWDGSIPFRRYWALTKYSPMQQSCNSIIANLGLFYIYFLFVCDADYNSLIIYR